MAVIISIILQQKSYFRILPSLTSGGSQNEEAALASAIELLSGEGGRRIEAASGAAGSSFVAAGLVFQAGMAFGAEGGVTPVSVGTMRMRFYDALFYYCFVFAVVRVSSSLFLESCIS